jgi:hypothetical protein
MLISYTHTHTQASLPYITLRSSSHSVPMNVASNKSMSQHIWPEHRTESMSFLQSMGLLPTASAYRNWNSASNKQANLSLNAVAPYLHHRITSSTHFQVPITQHVTPVSCSVKSAMFSVDNEPLCIQFRSVLVANRKCRSVDVDLKVIPWLSCI